MLLLCLYFTFPVFAQDHSMGYHKKFDNAENWTKIFDDPERDKWQKPAEVIKALKLKPEDKVADLGAGTGYFSFRIAKEYPKVTVYAVDVEPDMVKYVKKKAGENAVANVIALQTPSDELVLPEKVNLVLIVDTYHHIDHRINYFKKLQEKLLPRGRIAIIDYTPSSPMGPPAEHRISKEKVQSELKDAGYELVEDLDLLPNQHFLLFDVRPTSATSMPH